jgi:hypothetical protein
LLLWLRHKKAMIKPFKWAFCGHGKRLRIKAAQNYRIGRRTTLGYRCWIRICSAAAIKVECTAVRGNTPPAQARPNKRFGFDLGLLDIDAPYTAANSVQRAVDRKLYFGTGSWTCFKANNKMTHRSPP